MSTSQVEILNNPPLEKHEENPNKPEDENRPDQEGNEVLPSNLTQTQPTKEPVQAQIDDTRQNINEPSVAENPQTQEKHHEEKKPEETTKPDSQELIQKSPEIPQQVILESEHQAPVEQKEEKQTLENNAPKLEILVTETKSEKDESLKESKVEEQKPIPSMEVQKSSNLDVQEKNNPPPTLPTINSLIISQAQRPEAQSPAARESDNKKVQKAMSPKSKFNDNANKIDNKEASPKANNPTIPEEEIEKHPTERPSQNEVNPQEESPKQQPEENKQEEEKAPEPEHTEKIEQIEEKAQVQVQVQVQETHDVHNSGSENPVENAILSFISPNKVEGDGGSNEITAQLAEAFKGTPLVAKEEHIGAHEEKEVKPESVQPGTEEQKSPTKTAKKEKEEKHAEESENPEKPKKKKKKEKTPVQEAQEDNNNITEAISAFISPAKLGSDKASNEINVGLAEAFQGTSLVAKKKRGDIDPEDMEGVTGFGEDDEEAKEKKSDYESKSPKIKKQKSEKSEKSPTGKALLIDKKPNKMKNGYEIDTAGESYSTTKDLKTSSPKKPVQLKVKAELAAAAMKKKNTMEEQLRVHKMQEMSRWKKQLEGKLEAITEQIITLAQSDQERSNSLSQEGSAKKKLTKGEIAEKQKKATDLSKRMQMERKEMERRKEKRRDVRQAIVLKEIDLVHQRQLDNLELVNGAGSARARFENGVSKLKDKTKQESIFAALEEKKYEIKVKREFNKLTESDNNDFSDGSAGVSLERADNRKDRQGKIKMPKKQVYRSPVLNKVLMQDAEQKKIEFELKERRRLLHGRQVGYGKEVRDSFFPSLHPLKQVDSYVPIMNILYSPTRVPHEHLSPSKSTKEQIRLPNIEKRESPAKASQKSVSSVEELFKPKRAQVKQHQKDKEEFEEFMKNDANYEEQVEYREEEEWESNKKGIAQSKSVAARNKSLPAAQKRKQTVPEVEVDDYGYESRSDNHQQKKKVHAQKKEVEVEEEQNEWEQELEADQEIMKEKIAAMLGDIKKMETQIVDQIRNKEREQQLKKKQQQEEIRQKAKVEYQKKIQNENSQKEKTDDLIARLEQQEMELIQRLQKTQGLQKEAFDDLEKALAMNQ